VKYIYLDNSATTPVDPKVLQAMLPYFGEKFANASSIHSAGNEAMSAVIEARTKIASFLGCSPEELFFTGGATESDNLAVLGVIRAVRTASKSKKPHLIVSAIEHEAVLEPARILVKEGLAELSLLPVDENGLVKVGELKKLIKDNTCLVSVMLANNEIGTVQPIMEIGQLLASLNKTRKQKIYFHTDATQAPAYVDCSVGKLVVDLMSLSAHKIYGPKGVGALYVKKGTPISPLMYGGGQEKKFRSGTYNVPGIVGFGEAIKLIADQKSRAAEIKRVKNLRDDLIRRIKKAIPNCRVNGDLKNRLPNNVNFVFPGVEGESVVLMLSQKNIMASTGSACSSGSLDPSHVLLAIGLPPEMAHGSLRLSLGRFTKKTDIDAVVKILPPIIKKLREMSPLK
jgi:cysteine desulfurase